MTKREINYMATILDAVDEGDTRLPDVFEVLRQGMNFGDYVIAVNRLINAKLIWVDANHVAHRVRT